MNKKTLLLIPLLVACQQTNTVSNQAPDENMSPEPVVNINLTNPSLIRSSNNPVTNTELELVWQDEFNGEKLDPEKWYFETGDGSQYGLTGWGNNELQWYHPDNAELSDGKLIINLKSETVKNYPYTSARINTRDRFAFVYGRIEARIKLPAGQGVWPAFWLMPQDETYGTWAASGEIDIVEGINLTTASNPNQITGYIHYGDRWPNNVSQGQGYTPDSQVTEDFHIYALEWDETELRWYLDGENFLTIDSWYTADENFPAPFDQHFYILLNVAIGGNYPGSPDDTTVLPQTMEVDYVRVYSGQ